MIFLRLDDGAVSGGNGDEKLAYYTEKPARDSSGELLDDSSTVFSTMGHLVRY